MQESERDIHRLAQLSGGDRLIRRDKGFEIKDKQSFWFLDWFKGNARLGNVFETIRERLVVEGVDVAGQEEDSLIHDLASLRARIRDMKRHYDQKHGFFYRLFFDYDVDTNYESLLRQVDFLLAKLAKREIGELNAAVEGEAIKLRERLAGHWKEKKEELERKIYDAAQRLSGLRSRADSSDGMKLFLRWAEQRGAGEMDELWYHLWDRIGVAIAEGHEINDLLADETAKGFDSLDELSIYHHNEILSKLATWAGNVKEERKALINAMQQWHNLRQDQLKNLNSHYEVLCEHTQNLSELKALCELKDFFLERERLYLNLVDEVQKGLTDLTDLMGDGIRQLVKALMTDEYLEAKIAA